MCCVVFVNLVISMNVVDDGSGDGKVACYIIQFGIDCKKKVNVSTLVCHQTESLICAG